MDKIAEREDEGFRNWKNEKNIINNAFMEM